jgi:hypothetical protein
VYVEKKGFNFNSYNGDQFQTAHEVQIKNSMLLQDIADFNDPERL